MKEELPRGCSFEPATGFKAFLGRHIPNSRDTDPQKWDKKWGERERTAKGVLDAAVRHAVSRNIDQDPLFEGISGLDKIDPQIGTDLTNRTLLAQGLRDIKEGKLVVITNNRIGLPVNFETSFFAAGNEFGCGFGIEGSSGTRMFRAEFIGVVLNVESTAAQPFRSAVGNVLIEDLLIAINAVLQARKKYLICEREGRLGELFSQQETDQGTSWTLFGKI